MDVMRFKIITLSMALLLAAAKPLYSAKESLYWRFEYDQSNRVIARINPADQRTVFAYSWNKDSTLQTLTRTSADGRAVWQFDDEGRLAAVNSESGSYRCRYNQEGLLAAVERAGDPAIQYGYDGLGRLTSINIGGEYHLGYGYDYLGRIDKLVTPAGTITYDYLTGEGMTVRTLPNGIQTLWSSGFDGQLRQITHADRQNYVIAEYSYQHNSAGRIEAVQERSRWRENLQHFAYDPAGHLIQVQETNGNRWLYDYDELGNRIREVTPAESSNHLACDWAGRLTWADNQPCAHDSAGNLSSVVVRGVSYRYRFNCEGLLSGVLTQGDTIRYQYDADGRLIMRRKGNTRVKFIPDPLSQIWKPLIIEEADGTHVLIVWDGDSPLAIVRNGQREFLLQDHLGTPRAVMDMQGRQLRTGDFEPFGRPLDPEPGLLLSPGFGGLFWDKEADLYLARARAYSPQLGRFLQPDPRLELSWNYLAEEGFFAWCGSDPINFVDPLGGFREWYQTGGAWNSTPYFSAIHEDISRSVALQVANDKLRARVLAGSLAYERAITAQRLEHVTQVNRYDPNEMVFFVRTFRLYDIPGTAVPHTGIYFGREMMLEGFPMDGVELKVTTNTGRERGSVIAPLQLRQNEPGGTILLQPLETNRVRVVYNNRGISISDLPAEKKAEIQSAMLKRSMAAMGKSQGEYRAVGMGASNSCVDFVLQIADQAVQDAGLRFSGSGFRETFTTRLGNLAAANPTFAGGLAYDTPRMSNRISPGSLYNCSVANRVIDLGLKIGQEFQGRWGERAMDLSVGFQGYNLVNKAIETADYLNLHSGDPVGDMKVLSLGLKGLSTSLGGLTLGPAAAATSALIDLGTTVGSSVRSQVLQNRAEGLLYFGGTIQSPTYYSKSALESHSGRFERYGAGYEGRGAWQLSHSNGRWLERNTQSQMWATTRVHDLTTPSGNRISGTFSRAERRFESGGTLLNGYEPSSVTIHRYSHDQYTVTSGQQHGIIKLEDDPYRRQDLGDFSRRFHDGGPFGGGAGGGSGPGGPGGGGPGGPGGGGPGGLGGPGSRGPGNGGLGPAGRFFSSAMSPSPVGGVYLGDLGSALDSLGTISGIAVDSGGELVLLGSSEKETIKLPPLRIDDVVTIFRSVYLWGEGPTVTINPDSVKPATSSLVVKHGKATEETYVGWVLYQADRLMKGYTVGIDNLTGKEVVSKVPGFAEVLDSLYFGYHEPDTLSGKGHWERFWIVPDGAWRYNGPRSELALIEVPLKVRTQSMKWKNGQLVDDSTAVSSSGARAFSAWFTQNYEQIARENYLTPPQETGIAEPVPVFAELHRIALITAIAEKLRDQGTPMPFWMREHRVRPIPVDTRTPSLEVTRENIRVKAWVFGGVVTSPSPAEVKIYSEKSNLKTLPAAKQVTAERSIKLAASLEKALQTAHQHSDTPAVKLEISTDTQVRLPAAVFPGGDTQALGPCRLNEVDLSVPLSNGEALTLTRSFSSFFDALGPWGKAWTLDLPRLDQIRIPVYKEPGGSKSFQIGYELITPLNSNYARFSRIQSVAELQNVELLAPEQEGQFLGVGEYQSDFLSCSTSVVFLRDGRRWHFSKAGAFAAEEQGNTKTIYETDSNGRLNRIVGLLGGAVEASIHLEYNGLDRLSSAAGTNSQGTRSVTYQYADSGMLVCFRDSTGSVKYGYEGPWVKTISWQAQANTPAEWDTLHIFTYNQKGQLIAEKKGGTSGVQVAIASDTLGTTATFKNSASDEILQMVRFNPAMRPIEMQAAGLAATWKYPSPGSVETNIRDANGKELHLTASADGRRTVIEEEGTPPLTADFDKNGRLVRLESQVQPLIEQHWRDDGQPAQIVTPFNQVICEYNKEGSLERTVLLPAGDPDQVSHWQECRYDPQGLPVSIKDQNGLNLALSHDRKGRIDALIMQKGKDNLGYTVEHDDQDRITSVKSSWGDEHYHYSAARTLDSVTTTANGLTACTEYQNGLVHRIRRLDGSEIRYSYRSQDQQPAEIISANGIRIAFDYDSRQRLNRIGIGPRRQLLLHYDDAGRFAAYEWAAMAN